MQTKSLIKKIYIDFIYYHIDNDNHCQYLFSKKLKRLDLLDRSLHTWESGMKLRIAISSGKGGTGKTFVASNIAAVLAESASDLLQDCDKGTENAIRYLDCDVEEPNGHLFLKPVISEEVDVMLTSPVGIDEDKCIRCGKCVEVCNYNAVALVKEKVLFFPDLCHVCGGCKIMCPTDAIVEKDKKIGTLRHGRSGKIDFHYAMLETAEGGMSPRLIKRVRESIGEGINILDSSPGTACPVVETVKDVDLCVLVTDPTPFGINDLKLAVDMCRALEQEPVVLVNRAEYRDDSLLKYCREAELEIVGEIPDDRKIAESYSVGDLAVDTLPEYRALFHELALKIVRRARMKAPVLKRKTMAEVPATAVEKTIQYRTFSGKKPKELVVISGKGGTGKTSLIACFAALAGKTIISDCDVDAADLHLILEPTIKEKGIFIGGVNAEIDQDRCSQCGGCYEACRFDAIEKVNETYVINQTSCEGCGVCHLVCRDDAITISDAVSGEWYVSETRFGPMSHAKLGIAEENSGKLVTLVRSKKDGFVEKIKGAEALIDGSPGTGCPVIASITGSDYALIVTEPTVSGIHDMERILAVIDFFHVKSGIVVNKYDLNESMTERIRGLADQYRCDFIGVIPYDKRVTEAQMEKLSVVEYTEGPVTESIKAIWKEVESILR
jgi:MinD superfamily P-loop ATPase